MSKNVSKNEWVDMFREIGLTEEKYDELALRFRKAPSGSARGLLAVAGNPGRRDYRYQASEQVGPR